MKNFISIKNKGLGDIFLLGALVFTIVALVGYFLSGATEFNPKLQNSVIAPLIVSIILEVAFALFNSKTGKYACFVVLVYALLEYACSQMNYAANVFVAIDGTTFSAGFIIVTISFILALGLSLTSAIMAKPEQEILKKGE